MLVGNCPKLLARLAAVTKNRSLAVLGFRQKGGRLYHYRIELAA
jgi:hypothetical protein